MIIHEDILFERDCSVQLILQHYKPGTIDK